MPSSLGLFYFDRRTERLHASFNTMTPTRIALAITALCRSTVIGPACLWVGTQNGGLNILNFQQEQFGHYTHRPADPNSLSPGKVTAIYEDSNGVLWVGLFPRALDRLDRKTGKVTHYVPGPESKNSLSRGHELE